MALDPDVNLELTPMVMGKLALESGIQRVVIGEEDNKLATMIPDLCVKVHLTRSDLARCLKNVELLYGDSFNANHSAFSREPDSLQLDAFSDPNVRVSQTGSTFDLTALQEYRKSFSDTDKNHDFWIGQAAARVEQYGQKSAVVADGTGKEPMKLLSVITGHTSPSLDARGDTKTLERFYRTSSGEDVEGNNDPRGRINPVSLSYTTRATDSTPVTYQYVPFDTDHSVSDPDAVYGGLPEAFIRSISNNLYDITAGDEFALRALTRPPFVQELAGFWFDGCRVRNSDENRHATNFQFMMSGAVHKKGTIIGKSKTVPPDALDPISTVEEDLGYEPNGDSVNNPWDSPYGATILKNIVQKYYNLESGEMHAFDVITDADGTTIKLGDLGLIQREVTVNLYLVVNASVIKTATTTVELESEAIINGQEFSQSSLKFIPNANATGFTAPDNNTNNWMLKVKLVFDQPNTTSELNNFDGILDGRKLGNTNRIGQLDGDDGEIANALETVKQLGGDNFVSSDGSDIGGQLKNENDAVDTAEDTFNTNPSALNALDLDKKRVAATTTERLLSEAFAAYQQKLSEKKLLEDANGKIDTVKTKISELISPTDSSTNAGDALAAAVLAKEGQYETTISNLTSTPSGIDAGPSGGSG